MSKPKDEEIQEPNIQYVGKREVLNKETSLYELKPVPADRVPTWRRNGPKEFDLPSGEEQKKGFYHPEAYFLITAYRDEFKRPTKKGHKEQA